MTRTGRKPQVASHELRAASHELQAATNN